MRALSLASDEQTAAAVLALEGVEQNRWWNRVASHGFNGVLLPASWEHEIPPDTLVMLRRNALALLGEEASGHLKTLDRIAIEDLAQAAVRGEEGVLVEHACLNASSLQTIALFALWAEQAPWAELPREVERLSEDGVSGEMRRSEDGSHALLMLSANNSGGASNKFIVSGLSGTDHLIDVMNLATLRRRRFAATGSPLRLTLASAEVDRDCLVLIKPLAADWVAP